MLSGHHSSSAFYRLHQMEQDRSAWAPRHQRSKPSISAQDAQTLSLGKEWYVWTIMAGWWRTRFLTSDRAGMPQPRQMLPHVDGTSPKPHQSISKSWHFEDFNPSWYRFRRDFIFTCWLLDPEHPRAASHKMGWFRRTAPYLLALLPCDSASGRLWHQDYRCCH